MKNKSKPLFIIIPGVDVKDPLVRFGASVLAGLLLLLFRPTLAEFVGLGVLRIGLVIAGIGPKICDKLRKQPKIKFNVTS